MSYSRVGVLQSDVPLQGELGAEADEPMVGLIVDEIVEPIVEMEEQLVKKVIQVSDVDVADGITIGEISPTILVVEGQVQVMASKMVQAVDRPEQVGTQVEQGPSTADAEGQSFTLPSPGFLVPPSVIEDLSTRMGNLEYGHGQLVKKVIQVSDVDVADGITIGEISPTISVVEGQVQVMASKMVQATDRPEHVGTQVEQGQ
nr:hypothetical protein [Tanacetum cinerariifolium]